MAASRLEFFVFNLKFLIFIHNLHINFFASGFCHFYFDINSFLNLRRHQQRLQRPRRHQHQLRRQRQLRRRRHEKFKRHFDRPDGRVDSD